VVRQADGQLVWPIGPQGQVTAGGRTLTLDRVTISNGELNLHDDATGDLVQITDVFAQFSGDLTTGEASLTGSLQAAGIPITVDLLSRAQSGNGSLPVKLSLGIDGLDNELRYAGLVGRLETGSALSNLLSGRWDQLRLQGDLAVRGSNLAEALVRLGTAEQPAAAFEQPFSLDARFAARAGFAQTDKLTYSLGELEGSGSVMWNEAEQPAAVLTGVINRLDLDSVIGPPQEDGSAPAESLDRLLAWLENYRPSGGDLLYRLPSTDLRLSTDRLNLFGEEVRSVRLRAAIADKAISVGGFQATTPGGGDLRVRGGIDWAAGPANVSLAASLEDAAFKPLAQWLGIANGDGDGPKLNTVSLRGSLTGNPGNWRATGLDLALDASRVTGMLAFDRGDGPTLGIRLAADRLNLDSYRSADATGATWSWLTAHPWVTALREDGPPATVNFDLGATEILIDSKRLTGVAARGSITDSVLSLSELSADRLAGAAVRLTGRYAYSKDAAASTDPVIDLSGFIDTDDIAAFAQEMSITLPQLPQNPPSADLRARISGDLQGQLKANVTGAIAGLDVNLGGSLDLSGEPEWNGAVRLIHPDAAAVLATYLPDYKPVGASGEFDLFARLDGAVGDLSFNEMIGKIGKLVVAGNGHIGWQGGNTASVPKIEAALRTGSLRVDDWLPQTTSRSFGRWSSSRLSFDWLSAINAEIRLIGRSLTWNDITLQEPAASLIAENGSLEIERFSAKGWDGKIGLNGRLEPDSTGYKVNSRVDVVGVDARRFLNETVGAGAIDGRLDFGATVNTRGGSIRDWVGTLGGNALLAVREGGLDDMDLAEAAQWVAADEEPVVFLEGLRESLANGETQFQALNARMSINQGRLHTDDLRIAALETIGNGSGSFDLNRWEVDLTTDFTLRRLPAAPPLALRLEGAADRPQRRWLTEAVQAYVAQRAARALSDQFIKPDAQSVEETLADDPALPAAEAALPVDQPAVQ